MEQVKDDKKFFHVFPTLRADDDVRLLFSDVEVKKITTNSRRDFLNIYIFSRHLIQKKQIFQMEQCIKDQLFAKTAVAVHIVEEYMLSGQYTAEALMNEYRESIILELKEKSMLASNMFARLSDIQERPHLIPFILRALPTTVRASAWWKYWRRMECRWCSLC